MKKIILFSLIACFSTCFAYSAPRQYCQYETRFDTKNNNHNAGADEYLFKTWDEYRKAANLPNVYYCDEGNPGSYCGTDTYVKGRCFMGGCTSNERYFRCDTSGNDQWIEITEQEAKDYTLCTHLWTGRKDSASLPGSSNAESNDYVYPTQNEYDIAGNRVYASVYECDETSSSTAYCKIGTYITMPAGHYFQRNPVGTQRTYKCMHTSGNDFWEPVEDGNDDNNGGDDVTPPAPVVGACDAYSGDMLAFSCCNAAALSNAEVTFTNGKCECKEDPKKKWNGTQCTGGDGNDGNGGSNSVNITNIITAINSCVQVNNGTSVINLQNCSALKEESKTCEQQHPGNVELINCCIYQMAGQTTIDSYHKCLCTNPEEEWNQKKYRCEAKKQNKPGFCDQFKAYPARYACCIAGNYTKWSTSDPANGQCLCLDKKGNVDSTQTWNGKKCTGGNVVPPAGDCNAYMNNTSLYMCCNMAKVPNSEVTFNNGACACIDPSKQWNGAQCVGGSVTPPPAEVPDCWYEFHADVMCANNVRISYDKRINLKDKLNGQNCETFKTQFDTDTNKLNELKAEFCKKHGYEPYNDRELQNAKSKLASFFKSAESNANVWKDAEGNFNTARLASDITAGVVLGTVGGVISGVVIPKKQKEKGYEALNCTVGGQKMADWGDEFRVEFRR